MSQQDTDGPQIRRFEISKAARGYVVAIDGVVVTTTRGTTCIFRDRRAAEHFIADLPPTAAEFYALGSFGQ